MTTAFSRLVQASIYRKDKELVSLRQELEYVEFYLYLQCTRYDGSLSYKITLEDDSLMDCQVPKLCLQFIVENAVVHGLEPKSGGGTVEVLVSQRQGLLEMQVKDNGMGFGSTAGAEGLEGAIPLPLNLPSHQDQATHRHNGVGINNLHQLIKLLYGQEYGISIFSEAGKGTTVTILIPQLLVNTSNQEELCTKS
ncbi:MAG: histidine kinase, partial [Spirochaetaceae bacterium]|nr:histidine kinase [Spirochaetaceae bacterium]